MQKFYTQTLESLFIQNLLANTPLPIYETKRDGDFIIKGNYYIYKHEIVMCTKSGFLLNGSTPPLFPAENLFPREDLFPSGGSFTAEYDVVLRYEFGKYYPKITYMFKPKTNYYDSETHEQLGKYLRCIRDLYDVDYMPFYNCYSARNITNLIIANKSIQGKNKENLIAVPVLFNKPYTISVSSKTPVVMKPIKYGYKYIGDTFSTLADDFEGAKKYGIGTLKQLGIIDESKLTHYGIYTQDPDEVINEKFLYLCFQSQNIKSVAVIEGDYSQAEKRAGNNIGFTADVPNLTSKLSLLNTHDDFYAFSDRLVEGLLGNIVNSQEEIYWNIGMVQEALGRKRDNIWDNSLVPELFNKYMSDKNPYLNKYDITGNVDKDMEFYLFKGMN